MDKAESPWHAVVAELPAALNEEVIGALASCLRGAQTESLAAGRVRTRLYLRSTDDPARVLRRVREALAAFRLDGEECALRLEQVEDGRWVERYQESLRPFPLGGRFVVLPGGGGDTEGDRLPLRLVPGRAFGTGEHATTQLCVEMLERLVSAGSRWLDLGCGTAVLAMVARHCGAGEVLGVDTDPDAIDVARATLAANSMEGEVQLRHGSLEQARERLFDGVVSNVHAPFFHERGPDLARRLTSGGLLIASGFLEEDLAGISSTLADAGFVEIDRATRAPWAVWVARLDVTGTS